MTTVHDMVMPSGLTDDEAARWVQLESRKYAPTKFFDEEALAELGLAEPVETLLTHGGLGGFADLHAPTYPALVREFLATLEIDDGAIEFRLLGRRFQSSKATLGRALGVTLCWSNNWQRAQHRPPPAATWELATGQPAKKGGGNYNYSITHPALRLCHKVLNNTFFGQVEINKVSMKAWAWLYCLTPEAEIVPDWVQLFLETCLELLQEGAQRTTRTIAFGGLLTLIARRYRLDLSGLQALGGDSRLTIDVLRRARHLEGAMAPYLWKAGPQNEHVIRLPTDLPMGPTIAHFNVPPENLSDPEGDEFGPEDDEENQEEEQQVPPFMLQGEASASMEDSDEDMDYVPSPSYMASFDQRLSEIQQRQLAHEMEFRQSHAELRRHQDDHARALAEMQQSMNSFFTQFQQFYPFQPPPQ